MKRILLVAIFVAFLVPVASAQDDGAFGVYGSYFHLSQTDTNLEGIGARLSINVARPLQLEAEMTYDFEQSFTEEFRSSGGGVVSTFPSNVQLLDGLFGPKLQTPGPVKFFMTVKGGFMHFNLGHQPATFGSFFSDVSNLRDNNVSGLLYPGIGAEGRIGPVGLRLDVGDDIYFNSGAHHNFTISLGPVIYF